MPIPEAKGGHHRNVEQARERILALLQHQATERTLVDRAEARGREEVLAALVRRQQQAALEQRLAQLHPSDIAFLLEGLSLDVREAAFALVRPERRAAVLLEASDAVRATLIAGRPADEIVSLLRPLDTDDVASLLSPLAPVVREQVLDRLDRDGQAEVRSVLSFPPGTVGAHMAFDFIAVRDDTTLEAVHRLLRARKQLPPHTNQLWVVDRERTLKGLLPIGTLLVQPSETKVADVMVQTPVFFYTDDPMQEAITAFQKYDLISAPVVNLQNEAIGRLRVDTVLDAVRVRAETESLAQVGLPHGEDLYEPVVRSGRNRWPWLGLNLMTSFASSRVIGIFDDVIAQFAAVATLIPIVASLGGNTGTQTMELVIRALALDKLGPDQLRRTFLKEAGIALLNGSVWGAALGGLTFFLYGRPKLSLVIYGAMIIELMIAAIAGVVIPVTLKRIGRDPVMGSSVLLTATTDTAGFFLFLGLATVFLL